MIHLRIPFVWPHLAERAREDAAALRAVEHHDLARPYMRSRELCREALARRVAARMSTISWSSAIGAAS